MLSKLTASTSAAASADFIFSSTCEMFAKPIPRLSIYLIAEDFFNLLSLFESLIHFSLFSFIFFHTIFIGSDNIEGDSVENHFCTNVKILRSVVYEAPTIEFVLTRNRNLFRV